MKLSEKAMDIALILFLSLFMVTLIGSIFWAPADQDFHISDVKSFEAGWYILDQNGNRTYMEIPGDFENENGILIIHNEIPNLTNDKELCFRSSEQDIEVYIGGNLRSKYDTIAERTFGKNSASKYVFVELHPEDSGKQIDVYLKSTSMYGGRVNNILLGNQAAIIIREFNLYKYYDLGAIFLIFLGLIGIGQGCIMKFLYHRRPTLLYLGCLGLMTGLWRICESRMRQFYFNNNTAMSILAYTAFSMMPLFVLLFMDYAFSHRYRVAFHIMEGVALVMAVIEMALQITNTLDYVETMRLTWYIGFVFVAICMGFLIKEFYQGHTKKYSLTAIGIVCFFIFSLAELLMIRYIVPDRILMALGIMILFILTFIQEMKGLIASSIRESKKAQQKAEELTLQMVIALSATVDTKDKYTNGHSNRVAEYAREIAKRFGMTEKEQESIYYIGLLHDIGKIGVPDSIINKPGKLTDEEFMQIKNHPIQGSNILEQVTTMPELKTGARWHHERYDGKGYPDGLAGEKIPVEARIIAVADSYDAMTSYRSYRDSLPQQVVIDEITKGMGSQFDPVFAKIMLEMIEEDTEYKMREIRKH